MEAAGGVEHQSGGTEGKPFTSLLNSEYAGAVELGRREARVKLVLREGDNPDWG